MKRSKYIWSSILKLGLGLVALIPVMSGCVHGLGFGGDDLPLQGRAQIVMLKIADLPELPGSDGKIKLGGLSGLTTIGFDQNNQEWVLHAVTDRGPNGAPQPSESGPRRTYPLAEYQPAVVELRIDKELSQARYVKHTPLFRDGGMPVTGRTNRPGNAKTYRFDEQLLGPDGQVLPADPHGVDTEGLVRGPRGDYWMVEEYRPSLLQVGRDGQILNRFLAAGVNEGGSNIGIETLPRAFGYRRANRGLEAIARDGDRLFLFMQSPLDLPDTSDDRHSKGAKQQPWIRVASFSIDQQKGLGQFLYPLDGAGVDKIAGAMQRRPGVLWVLERDSSEQTDSRKRIYQWRPKRRDSLRGDERLEPEWELERRLIEKRDTVPLAPVAKELVLDLGPLLANHPGAWGKPEGLAQLNRDAIAVVFDNDFGQAGKRAAQDSWLAVIRFMKPGQKEPGDASASKEP